MKLHLYSAVIAGSLTLFGCGGGSASDTDGIIQTDETAQTNETSQTDETAQPEETTQIDETAQPDETAQIDVSQNSPDDIEEATGNNRQLVGVWEQCFTGIFAFIWEFNEDNTWRSYGVDDCSDSFGIEQSTQGGTYEILTTGTSEEGLPVSEIRFIITDIFGGMPTQLAPDLYNIAHVDGDNLFLGIGGGTQEEVPRNLNLDTPHIRK